MKQLNRRQLNTAVNRKPDTQTVRVFGCRTLRHVEGKFLIFKGVGWSGAKPKKDRKQAKKHPNPEKARKKQDRFQNCKNWSLKLGFCSYGCKKDR